MTPPVPCEKHPDRRGDYGVSLNYLNGSNWRDPLRSIQVLDALCEECRLALIHWIATPANTSSPEEHNETGTKCPLCGEHWPDAVFNLAEHLARFCPMRSHAK